MSGTDDWRRRPWEYEYMVDEHRRSLDMLQRITDGQRRCVIEEDREASGTERRLTDERH